MQRTIMVLTTVSSRDDNGLDNWEDRVARGECSETISVSAVREEHIFLNEIRIQGTVYRRKGKMHHRQPLMQYDLCTSWDTINPIALIYRWEDSKTE